MKLSVIVVAYENPTKTKACLASIPNYDWIEKIVIDNTNTNRGFSKACNIGANQAKGEFLLFLNPDTVVHENAIEHMLRCFEIDQDIEMVAPQLVDTFKHPTLSFTKQPRLSDLLVVFSAVDQLWPDNRLSQRFWYRDKSLTKSRYVEAVSGAAIMMRQSYFWYLGGFDERFFMYWEDMDLCRRVIHDGKLVYYTAEAHIAHEHGGVTPNTKTVYGWFMNSRRDFFEKYFGLLGLILHWCLRAMEQWNVIALLILIMSGVFIWLR